MSSTLRSLCRRPLLALALLASPPAAATLMQPLDVSDMARRADVVVHGRAVGVETVRGAGGMPLTLARIEVLEVLAGDLPPRRHLVVSQPGGRLDEVSLDYAGRPRFHPGQESVLFLARRSAGRFIIVGLAQGKLDVTTDGSGGRGTLRRDLHGAMWIGGQAAGAMPQDMDALRAALAALPRSLGGKP